MCSLIAEASFDSISQNKQRYKLTIGIGQPIYDGNVWTCEVHLNNEIVKVHGEDSLQALCMAHHIVKCHLKLSKALYFPGTNNALSVSIYYPDDPVM